MVAVLESSTGLQAASNNDSSSEAWSTRLGMFITPSYGQADSISQISGFGQSRPGKTAISLPVSFAAPIAAVHYIFCIFNIMLIEINLIK
jgi:hypothetical protein